MSKIVYARAPESNVNIALNGSLFPQAGKRKCQPFGTQLVFYRGAGERGVIRRLWDARLSSWDEYVMIDFSVRVWIDRGNLESAPNDPPDLELPFKRIFGMSYVISPPNDTRNLMHLPHASISAKYGYSMFAFGWTAPFDIPYANGIWLEASDPFTNIGYIEWEEGLAGAHTNWRLRSCRWQGTIPYGDRQVVADIPGDGVLFATFAAIEGADAHFQVLENNVEIYRDGEQVPSWESTSLEDYFSNSYYYMHGEHYTSLTGTFYANQTLAKAECYRWLDIPFQNGAVIVIPNDDPANSEGAMMTLDWLTLYYGSESPNIPE